MNTYLHLYPVTEDIYFDQMCCLAPIDRRNGCFLVGEVSGERLCEVTGELTDTYQWYICLGSLFYYIGHTTTRAEFSQFLDCLNIQPLSVVFN